MARVIQKAHPQRACLKPIAFAPRWSTPRSSASIATMNRVKSIQKMSIDLLAQCLPATAVQVPVDEPRAEYSENEQRACLQHPAKDQVPHAEERTIDQAAAGDPISSRPG